MPNARIANDVPHGRTGYSNVAFQGPSGSPIGLLLALTYATETTIASRGGYSPHARITTN